MLRRASGVASGRRDGVNLGPGSVLIAGKEGMGAQPWILAGGYFDICFLMESGLLKEVKC